MAQKEWVYADESGIHNDAEYCLVAGYRGSSSQWKNFNREWRIILNKPEYQIKESFHSNVFFNRGLTHNNNPYKHWTNEKAQAFLEELLDVVRRNKITPVGCAVVVKDFEALSYGEQCVLVGYITKKAIRQYRVKPVPYHYAVRGLVECSLKTIADDTELHFVLAEQKEFHQRALDGYTLLKKVFELYGGEKEKAALKRLKSMGFKSPSDFPALQAADLYANRWYYTLVHKKEYNSLHKKAMNQLTYRNREIPIFNATFMNDCFRNAGITGADRERLQSVPKPS